MSIVLAAAEADAEARKRTRQAEIKEEEEKERRVDERLEEMNEIIDARKRLMRGRVRLFHSWLLIFFLRSQ